MYKETPVGIDKLNTILKNNPDIGRSDIQVLENLDLDKQRIAIFLVNGQNRKLAFRFIKNSNTPVGMIKFSEYINCQRLKNLQTRAPKVFYIDHDDKEVITEWFDGEAIADFSSDQITKYIPTQEDIIGIEDAFVTLHSNLSDGFSNAEEEPTMNRWYIDIFEKSDKQDLFQFVITSYRRVFPNLDAAIGNSALKRVLPEVRQICDYGLIFLARQKAIIESVPAFSLLHGDATPENIIRTADDIRLIDFEYMHYGDPAAELAFFFEEGTQLGFINDKAKNRFVASYKRKMHLLTGIDDETLTPRIDAYQVYVMFKFLGLICNGLTSDTKDDVNFRLLEDILTRSRDLAWKL